VKQRKVIQTLDNGPSRIANVSFSHDDRVLAVTAFDDTIRFYDTSNGSRLATLKGHQCSWAEFSPVEDLFAGATQQKTVNVWRLDFADLLRR
jgi:WD40 repeat protein